MKKLLLLCVALACLADIAQADTVIRQKPAGGTGLTSLEGQTGSTQTFTDDTNVTIVSGADAHVITWAGILASSRGGTGNGFTKFSGPATSEKTFTLPNASATIATLEGVESFVTGTKTVTSKFDFGGGTLEIPNSTSLPGTCVVGEAYMDTNATSGQRLYLCESANTWALQGDGGGGSGVTIGAAVSGGTAQRILIVDGSGNVGEIALADGEVITAAAGALTAGSITPPTFAQITTGSNTGATMTVGTGGTITTSGSGVVNANQIRGTAISGTSMDSSHYLKGDGSWGTGGSGGATAICSEAHDGAAFATSTKYYIGNGGGFSTNTTVGGYTTYTAATIVGFSFFLTNTAGVFGGAAENITFSLMKNGDSGTQSGTQTADFTGAVKAVSKSGLSIAIDPASGDYFMFRIDTPVTLTNAASMSVRMTACAFLTIP